jgi:hypothetical protein
MKLYLGGNFLGQIAIETNRWAVINWVNFEQEMRVSSEDSSKIKNWKVIFLLKVFRFTLILVLVTLISLFLKVKTFRIDGKLLQEGVFEKGNGEVFLEHYAAGNCLLQVSLNDDYKTRMLSKI